MFCLYMSLLEVRKWCLLDPLEWHYRWLWTGIDVLRIELQSSGRTADPLNWWAISPACRVTVLMISGSFKARTGYLFVYLFLRHLTMHGLKDQLLLLNVQVLRAGKVVPLEECHADMRTWVDWVWWHTFKTPALGRMRRGESLWLNCQDSGLSEWLCLKNQGGWLLRNDTWGSSLFFTGTPKPMGICAHTGTHAHKNLCGRLKSHLHLFIFLHF